VEEKLYTEEEKNFHVAQGIWQNNNLIFKMIENDINHLITSSILKFLEGNPKIKALCSVQSGLAIEDCKE
jgi:hypothetical protein